MKYNIIPLPSILRSNLVASEVDAENPEDALVTFSDDLLDASAYFCAVTDEELGQTVEKLTTDFVGNAQEEALKIARNAYEEAIKSCFRREWEHSRLRSHGASASDAEPIVNRAYELYRADENQSMEGCLAQAYLAHWRERFSKL